MLRVAVTLYSLGGFGYLCSSNFSNNFKFHKFKSNVMKLNFTFS
jgi:hypothetical protein